MSLQAGLRAGVLTVVDWETGGRFSLPWPPPPAKDLLGYWEPAVLERFSDGTALALWRWHGGMDDGAERPQREDPGLDEAGAEAPPDGP